MLIDDWENSSSFAQASMARVTSRVDGQAPRSTLRCSPRSTVTSNDMVPAFELVAEFLAGPSDIWIEPRQVEMREDNEFHGLIF